LDGRLTKLCSFGFPVGGSLSCSGPAAASSSSATLPARHFSSSPISQESKQKRKARLVRKAHLDKKADLSRADSLLAADPVLGYGLGREAVWDQSELKSLLLSREQVWGETVKVVPGEGGAFRGAAGAAAGGAVAAEDPAFPTTGYTPSEFNFGLAKEDAEQLSTILPLVSAQRIALGGPHEFGAAMEKRAQAAEELEQEKRDKLMRIIDLRNANAKGIEVENTRRIVNAFGRAEGDTGSPEVQGKPKPIRPASHTYHATDQLITLSPTAAIMTSRIHSLLSHLVSQPRDIHNRRPLQSLIQQRAKVLKYLRSIDVQRYENILPRIGVEARSVEGEVIVTKPKLRELIRGI